MTTQMNTDPWEVVFYEAQGGARPAEDWLKDRGPKVAARFAWIFDLLEDQGTNVTRPYVDHLRGKIWEVRVEQNKVQYRMLYFAAPERKFVMLHGFIKKTQRTPPKEIDVAEERMNDYMERLKQANKGR